MENLFGGPIFLNKISYMICTAKTNIDFIERAQRRILRAFFFKKYTESFSIVLTNYKILTACKLYISELIREDFLQR